MNNEDAVRILLNSNEYHHAKGDLPNSAASIEAFNKAIAALKAERPRGKWVFDGCDDVTCKCMFCGHEHVYVTSPKADGVNFCEQCGADMRGDI